MTLTLKSRIRDAELSVRTANLLCKQFGEDVIFDDLKDYGDQPQMVILLGRKGLKEFNEVLGYARDGSHPEPSPVPAKTLRDEFAMLVDRDEYGDLLYRNVSREFGEQLVGRPYPSEPADVRANRAPYQLDMLRWNMDVLARLRFMYADAMMAAREK